MKIGYVKYPILEKLHTGILGKLPILEKDLPFFLLYSDMFKSKWEENCSVFKGDINVITEPFDNACDKARPNLVELFKHIQLDDISDFSCRGTFVLNNTTWMINYNTKKGSEDVSASIYYFENSGIPLAMWNVENGKKEAIWISNCFNVKPIGEIKPTYETSMAWLAPRIMYVFSISMFKSYATVDTKIIEPGQRAKTDCHTYRNETKNKVTILDCKWFTNIVKSDAFNVRGHLRLQPKKKNGVWVKELIWISEFEKSGYTSKAKILSYNN